MNTYKTGQILVAHPFLKDDNFSRSIVLLADVAKSAAMGFILNKPFFRNLNDLIVDLDAIHFPVYNGGPVQQDTLHFLHKRPDLIDDGNKICEHVFWGGNFELALSLVKDGILTPRDIRFFLGYSGWDEDQLHQEFKENSWLLHDGKSKFVFHHNNSTLWKDVLYDMGTAFSKFANYPIDPQLN